MHRKTHDKTDGHKHTHRTQGGINTNSLLDAEASSINLESDRQRIEETEGSVKQNE